MRRPVLVAIALCGVVLVVAGVLLVPWLRTLGEPSANRFFEIAPAIKEQYIVVLLIHEYELAA
jgi:hypothetical protein